ncbi:MAG: hypothetical protein QXO12_01555 [Candidatus Pacearchaeota archaeon]
MKTIRCKLCNQLGHKTYECPIAREFYKYNPKIGYSFSGSSPPEIFVGRYGYPNVFVGILAPNEYGETEKFSMPELWFKYGFNIKDILEHRSKLIYSRIIVNIKNKKNKNLEVMQEISLSSRHVDASFELEKKPKNMLITNSFWPIIGNPASLKQVKLESNPKVERKVEYLVEDYDIKASDAILELYKAKINISTIIKILTAGLLGLKIQRKLVPTRWAVTAVDDIISKKIIEKIKNYKIINEFRVFYAEYLGNHYEIILFPTNWSFEVIEAKMQEHLWNKDCPFIAVDYENYFGRKKYASNVTGAYYANRLAVAEYLEKIKRQAAALILREVKPSYYAPCGVGILREACRYALSKKAEIFDSLEEALERVSERMELDIKIFVNNSWLIKKFKEQKSLKYFTKKF